MTGIVGMVGEANESLLDRMCASIKHETWYQTDKHINKKVAIARVHLGTFNPESQPIFDRGKKMGIFMDGEIYDYDEEKKDLLTKGYHFEVNNEPELCLNLFKEHGIKFAKKLDGSFIIAIFDLENETFFILNDRYGSRPIYYCSSGGKFLFSPEVKAILKDKSLKREVNDTAVAEFFAFRNILGDKTFFKEIKLLPPAAILTWKNERFSIDRYWDYEFKEKYEKNKRYYVENLFRFLRKAVERKIRNKHRLGLSLSGGLDSRAIIAIMARSSSPINTFTFGEEGGEEPKIAQRIAKKSRTNHEFLPLKEDYIADFAERCVYLTDGMVNCIHFHLISVLDKIRENSDILILGSGLGAMLGGYHIVDKGYLSMKSNEEVATRLYQDLNVTIREDEMPNFFSEEYYWKIKDKAFNSLKREVAKSTASNPANKAYYTLFQNDLRRFNLLGPVYIRSKVETRVPNLDNEYVDFLLSIPPKLRFGRKLEHELVRKLDPELAKEPYAQTGVPVSMPILFHKVGSGIIHLGKLFNDKLKRISWGKISIPYKMGYPDYGKWMRRNEKFRKFIEDLLLDERTLNRGYFNSEYVRKIVHEHMSYKKDNTVQLGALITFELWNRLFIDKS